MWWRTSLQKWLLFETQPWLIFKKSLGLSNFSIKDIDVMENQNFKNDCYLRHSPDRSLLNLLACQIWSRKISMWRRTKPSKCRLFETQLWKIFCKSSCMSKMSTKDIDVARNQTLKNSDYLRHSPERSLVNLLVCQIWALKTSIW